MLGLEEYLARLSLVNYRNFSQPLNFHFTQPIIIFSGSNAVGKTNLLEAIYLLGNGVGFREQTAADFFNNPSQPVQIQGEISNQNQEITKLGLNFFFNVEGKINKNYLVNNLKKTQAEYLSRVFPVVLFEPTDLDLIIGPPKRRRTFVDRLLMAVHYPYRQAKNNYEKGLYKRNKLLENFAHNQPSTFTELIGFWDDYLIKNALVLNQYRFQLADFLNANPQFGDNSFGFIYEPNFITQEILAQNRAAEIKNRKTCFGPQLDDFVFMKKTSKGKKILSSLGSRSEQRMAVIWLKNLELKYLEKQLGKKPLLLLDDVFSEFDEKNSQKIFSLCQNKQVFITASNLKFLNNFSQKYQTVAVC